MQKTHILKKMLGVATLAMMFGTTAAYAQSSQSSSGTSGGTSGASSSSASPAKGDASSTGSSSTTDKSGASAKGGDASASAAKGSGGKSLSKADQNMMREMAYSNLAEIETAKLAQSKSQNDQVKTYAQKMIDDHTKAQQELEQLAQAKGVTLPKEPDKKHQAAMKKMEALSGDKFDKQYMAQGGVKDHRDTHKLLTKAQKSATDPDLKAMVTKMTPVVDQHLNMAQEMQSGKGASSGSSGSSSDASKSGASGASSTSGSSDKAGASSGSGASGSGSSSK